MGFNVFIIHGIRSKNGMQWDTPITIFSRAVLILLGRISVHFRDGNGV